jgi:hypothetical protein
MSYEESDARRKSNMGFRTVMDLGMGVFYIGIGGWLLIYKSFGNMAIPVWLAYLLGGMMAVGGGLRLYKGIIAVLPAKRDEEI